MLYRPIDIPKGTNTLDPVFPSTGVTRFIVGSEADIRNRVTGIGKAVAMVAGAIAFFPEDNLTDEMLRKLAKRFETYLLPKMVSGEDYEILWGTFTKGNSTELRYVLPLVRRKDAKPLVVSPKLINDVAIWVRVQNLSFGWRDPNPPVRAGVRPDFRPGQAKAGVKADIVEYLEEAVLAGDLSSRDEVIEDLSSIGFEVRAKEPQGLTVRYTGDNSAVHRKDILLEGVIFDQTFGQQDAVLGAEQKAAIDAAILDGLKRIDDLVSEAGAKLKRQLQERLSGAVSSEIKDCTATIVAEGAKVRALIETDEKSFGEKSEDIRKTLKELVSQISRETAAATDEIGKVVSDAMSSLDKQVNASAKKVEHAVSAEVVQKDAKLAEMSQRIEALAKQTQTFESKAKVVKGAALVAAAFIGISVSASIWAVWSVVPNAVRADRLLDQAEKTSVAVIQNFDTADATLAKGIEITEESSAALAAAQAGMVSLLTHITDVEKAFAVEKKADGTDALTVYIRRLPNVQDCDRDATCVVRLNRSSP